MKKKSFYIGFTLIEITITIAIIALLLTLGSNLIVFSKKTSRDAKRKIDVEQIRSALEFYKEDDTNRDYPVAEDIDDLKNKLSDYIKQASNDPLINTGLEYYYYKDSENKNYILGAYLETLKDLQICGSCGIKMCNYCYSSYGLLINPTPSTRPVITPTDTPTATPTPIPQLKCGNNPFNLTAGVGQSLSVQNIGEETFDSDNINWQINETGLQCNKSLQGFIVYLTCQNAGTASIKITAVSNEGNTYLLNCGLNVQ